MPKAKVSESTDAIAILKADHRAVEALFAKFEKTSAKAAKQKIANDICMELTIHAIVEEELFYPTFKGVIDDAKLDEAYVEHDGAKMLIAEITMSSPDDDFYNAKVKVLSEEIKHHVKEEEQRGGLFAQARHTNCDLVDLGRQIMERKNELKTKFNRTGLPAPEARTLQGARLKYGEPLESQAAA